MDSSPPTQSSPGPGPGDPAAPSPAPVALPTAIPIAPLAPWHAAPVLYPDRYLWYVLVSTMDIITTVVVLIHYGAREVNSIAQASINLFGTWGLIGLKFASLILVVAICEFIGRRHRALGRRIATIAVVLSLSPVAAATAQVFWLWSRGDLVYTEGPPRTPIEERRP